MTTEKNSGPPETALQLPAPGTVTSEMLSADEQKRVWKSDDLLGSDTEALIVHRGQTYRLRCTKQGKLILYK
ncbi:hemin uptake protein HemP [Anatilimnocola floriformis]|uniref:hemin uptake protein HemP n=1 Tax=Anatilimnocola floriformis TaxID=2948575 RepID=UPI0020C430B5|nr:hemin uptake protein HemP [Anatilimnocola floriformis]